jgi:hypothetical protein
VASSDIRIEIGRKSPDKNGPKWPIFAEASGWEIGGPATGLLDNEFDNNPGCRQQGGLLNNIIRLSASLKIYGGNTA